MAWRPASGRLPATCCRFTHRVSSQLSGVPQSETRRTTYEVSVAKLGTEHRQIERTLVHLLPVASTWSPERSLSADESWSKFPSFHAVTNAFPFCVSFTL